MSHYVYIVQCNDGSYYVGQATNVEERVDGHNAGRGCEYTRTRRPVVLAHKEEFITKSDATRRERQLKTWSRSKKEALIHNRIAKAMPQHRGPVRGQC